jgi:hypothetical protein
MAEPIQFSVYDGRLCLAKLPPDTKLASIPRTVGFFSLTANDDEISVIAGEQFLHPKAEIERGWRAIKVKGPLEFELKGVLASLLNPLTDADISVFALSTYNTDYILVKDYQLDRACEALRAAGHIDLSD